MTKLKGMKWIARVISIIMIANLLALAPLALDVRTDQPAKEGTYYVSALDGSDANDGTTPDKAWKTLDKVNGVTFEPGDTILFDNKSSWEGQLYPKGSGVAGNPIIIDKYGDGDRKPLIQGNGIVEGDDTAKDPKTYAAAIFLYNQQHWEINNMEVTNFSIKTSTFQTYDGGGNVITKTNVIPSKYGILVVAKDSGTMNHVYIKDCNVHSVNSDPIDNRGAGIGRGGIIFIIRGNTVPTRWNDVIVENNKVGPKITHYGINFLSTWVDSSAAIFPHESGLPTSEYAGKRADSTNIIIRGNYCVDVGNAAICPSGYENVVIERNISDVCNSGTNGNVPIWWQIGRNTIVQYNEVFGTGASTSKEDSQAFDADLSATENIVQYNYTHDNPSGSYFECALGTVYTTHYRYNISANDGSGTNSHGGGAVVTIGGYSTNRGSKLFVYNNDMYIGPGQVGYIANSWDSDPLKDNFIFTNNVIYSEGTSRGWETRFGKGSTVENNFYGGSDIDAINRTDDNNAVYEGAKTLGIPNLTQQLSLSMEQATGWENIEAYRRTKDSVLHGAGTNIPYNGGLDIFGNTVSAFGAPSVGAHETGADLDTPEGAEVLDFESGLAEQPGIGDSVSLYRQNYNGATFATTGWTAVGTDENGTELMISKKGVSSALNQIIIPKGYVLYGFSARTSNSGKVAVEWNGTTKNFYLSSSKNSYITEFENAASKDKAVNFSVSTPAGVSEVFFDNIIIKRADNAQEATNVALEKPATQNDGYNSASYGNDGNVNTFGGNSGEFPYVWQVDLQDIYALDSVEIEWEDLYTGEAGAGTNIPEDWKYTIQSSLDGTNWDTIVDYSQTNPYTDIATSMVQNKETADLRSRYLKVTISGRPTGKSGAWAVLPEFRAFGVKLSDLYVNVALNKSASQSGGANSASLGNDGKMDTWAGNINAAYTWNVDLGSTHNIKSMEVEWEDLVSSGVNIAEDWKYKISYSLDNESWTTAVDYSLSNPFTDPATSTLQEKKFDDEIEARYIRLHISGKPTNRPTAWYVLPEFRAFGIPVGGDVEEVDITNLAYGKPVQASGETVENPAANITDGDITTSWATTSDGSWARIDMGLSYDIVSAKVTGSGAYTVSTSQDGINWSKWWSGEDVDTTDRPTVGRYIRIEADEDAEINLVQVWGSESSTEQKTIMILAPHPDDEALMGGGVIRRALDNGDRVVVLMATLGDYNGITSGRNRMVETINAMEKLGLPMENIMFLNYGDDGGLEQFSPQKYSDSTLYKLYVATDPKKVFTSRAGQTSTYDGIVKSYHNIRYGEQAAYTRENFLGDMQSAIDSVRPDEIYTTSSFDMHADHATIGLFAGEAIINIRKSDLNFNPTVYEALIHACSGDNDWPEKNSDANGIRPFTMPSGLESATPLRWNERVSFTVPEDMLVTPFANNLKDQALRKYTSQYSTYIGSFAKYDEVFWQRDFSGISYYANVSASSEKVNADGALDQSAIKAIDGVRDGYSTSLSETGLTSHNRFPFAEWNSESEKAGAWLQLDWEDTYAVSEVKLYDRPSASEQVLKGTLTFSDGTNIKVDALPNDGSALNVSFEEKIVKWVRFTVDEVSATTTSVGLAEIEVFGDITEVINFSALDAEIISAQDIITNGDKYVSTTIAGLDTKLENAKAVRANSSSTQDAVDSCAAELASATAKARLKADFSRLENILREIEDFDFTPYTVDSVKNVTDLVELAKMFTADQLQADVDSMEADLRQAMDNLKPISTSPTESTNPTDSTDPTESKTPTKSTNPTESKTPDTGNKSAKLAGLFVLGASLACGYIIKRKKKNPNNG